MNIRSITVRHASMDYIAITLDGNTPFPAFEAREPGCYPAVLRIETAKGYGLEWLKNFLGEDFTKVTIQEFTDPDNYNNNYPSLRR